MANPSVSEPAASYRVAKMACLCSPTNHPGSFRCSRHRTPRARPLQSSSFIRASQKHAQAPGTTGIKTDGGGRTTTSKGRPVLRAHVYRLLASPSPSSGGSDHRRCREFKPRLSRLGRLAAVHS